jgi:BlaI family transcriptional regulator, penicillinase repressor
MTKVPRISDAEWQVMKIVWRQSPITTNEVVEALAPVTEWKPKTIMTLLNRLVKKGALGFEKIGRAYSYHPKVDEAECVGAESRSFLERVYGGALTPMLAHFLQDNRLSKKDIEELKKILDEGRR